MENITQENEKFNPKDYLIDLKGKSYLQVMYRLVWFRKEKPNWCIDTEAHTLNQDIAIFKAHIYDENGALKSTGYGSEQPKDFKDFIEKAETKAVGRALAMLGYGTQFTDDFDEGERIVDSPVPKKDEQKKKEDDIYFRCDECGEILKPYCDDNGVEIPIRRHVNRSNSIFGKTLCLDCIKKRKENE